MSGPSGWRGARSLATLGAILPVALALAACQPDGPLGPEDTPGILAARSAGGGEITIVLNMRPETPADVAFAIQGPSRKRFVLDDDADPKLSNTGAYTNLKAGTYMVTQSDAPDGPLMQIRCVSSGIDNNTVDVAGATVTIELEADESVTCTFVDGWEEGDLITYVQIQWGSDNTLGSFVLARHFGGIFGGIFDVGILGTAGFSMTFSSSSRLIEYLPAGGTAGALDRDLLNPMTTSSGVLGGQVSALKLNVDFDDHGVMLTPDLTGKTADVLFGDLRLCDVTTSGLTGVNNLGVRDVLATANTAIGGGSTSGFSYADLATIAGDLNAAFPGGALGTFAQDHLFVGACP